MPKSRRDRPRHYVIAVATFALESRPKSISVRGGHHARLLTDVTVRRPIFVFCTGDYCTHMLRKRGARERIGAGGIWGGGGISISFPSRDSKHDGFCIFSLFFFLHVVVLKKS